MSVGHVRVCEPCKNGLSIRADSCGSKETCIRWGQGRTNPFAATRGVKIAMRPFVRILCPFVIIVIHQHLRCMFVATVQYYLPLDLITRPAFTEWMELVSRIADRPVPEVCLLTVHYRVAQNNHATGQCESKRCHIAIASNFTTYLLIFENFFIVKLFS